MSESPATEDQDDEEDLSAPNHYRLERSVQRTMDQIHRQRELEEQRKKMEQLKAMEFGWNYIANLDSFMVQKTNKKYGVMA